MGRQSDDAVVRLRMHCHAETGKAMLLSDDGEEGNAKWTPKSQIIKTDIGRDEEGWVTMKRWIADKNGFGYDEAEVIE